MRKLLIFTAAALLILIGIWGSLMLYFTDERLKQIAVEQVRAQTGRELMIAGPLELDLFPRVALKAEQVSLSGPADYDGPDLFTAEEFSMSLSLLPLIRGRVETGDIELSGADIALHTDRAGNSTLDGLSGEAAEPPPTNEQTERPAVTTGAIRLNDVNLVVSDASTGDVQRFIVERLQIDRFRFDQATPFRFEGAVGEPPVVQDLRIDGNITVPFGEGAITVDELSVSALASAIELELEGAILIEPGPPLRAELNDGQLWLNDQAYAVDFNYSDSGRPLVQASLSGDMLDVDALLAGVAPSETDTESAAESPLLVFRDMDLNAELDLQAMRISGLTLSDIQARAVAQNGVLTLDPLSGALSGGAVNATARVDLNQTPPALQVQPSFELSALDEALAPWGLDTFVSGAGDLNLNLSARGLAPNEILGSLTGQGQYDFRDGAINGINLDGMVEGLAERNIAAAVTAGVGGRTQFSRFAGPVEINDGTIRLPNIELVSQLLGVSGDVFLNIGDLSLDGNLRMDNERLNAVPLALSGTLLRPQLTPDVSGALREEAERRVFDLLRRGLNDDENEETDDEP